LSIANGVRIGFLNMEAPKTPETGPKHWAQTLAHLNVKHTEVGTLCLCFLKLNTKWLLESLC